VYTRGINRWLLTLLLMLGIGAMPSSAVEAHAATDRGSLGETAAAHDAPSRPEASLQAGGEPRRSPAEQAATRGHLCEDEAPEDVDDAEDLDGLTPPPAHFFIGCLEAAWPLKAYDLTLLRPPHV
jgi:hypothetical protein